MCEVVALHKNRFVIPISLAVTRVSGSGQDSIFMGVMRPAKVDPGTVKVWMMPNGVMLCVDQAFLDYAGWGASEMVGRPLNILGADPELLDG